MFDLGARLFEQIDCPLHVIDASREVRTALEELHLLAEVIHVIAGPAGARERGQGSRVSVRGGFESSLDDQKAVCVGCCRRLVSGQQGTTLPSMVVPGA